MSKKFFEVFPTLQFDKKMKSLLENTFIERVTSNRQKDLIRIYLQSDHLLQKDFVWETENQIKKQLFPSHAMEIKIQEKYTLSSQYTLENLILGVNKLFLQDCGGSGLITELCLDSCDPLYPPGSSFHGISQARTLEWVTMFSSRGSS